MLCSRIAAALLGATALSSIGAFAPQAYAADTQAKETTDVGEVTVTARRRDESIGDSFYAFFGGWAPPRQFGVRLSATF